MNPERQESNSAAGARGETRPGNAARGQAGASPAPSRYDAIIAGGGPAGLAAAYTLARGGARTVCLERGDWSGSKNMMGGLIFSQPTGSVFPEFWREAPLERHVTRRDMWLATGDSAIKLSFETADFAVEPYNSFTVYRSSFDKWLAHQAAAAGDDGVVAGRCRGSPGLPARRVPRPGFSAGAGR